jgi:hypothetical protein
MTAEAASAIIALVGIFISMLVSIYTSRRQTKTELEKLRFEIKQSYAGRLLEKRLDAYPGLYYLLSSFAKKLKPDLLSRTDVETFHEQLNEWDSRNSLLFTAQTGLIHFNFRRLLTKLVNVTDEEFTRQLAFVEYCDDLRNKVGQLELALKNDLGIYVVEFDDLSKRFTSYEEIAKALDKVKLNR